MANSKNKIKYLLNHCSHHNCQHSYRNDILWKETTNTTDVCLLQTIFADQPNSAACGLSPGAQ
jgi:hypothetical protein